MVGEKIPYSELGYKNLEDFLKSIDFVDIKRNLTGESILQVSDPKVSHIQDLVSKQKNSSNRNGKYKVRCISFSSVFFFFFLSICLNTRLYDYTPDFREIRTDVEMTQEIGLSHTIDQTQIVTPSPTTERITTTTVAQT